MGRTGGERKPRDRTGDGEQAIFDQVPHPTLYTLQPKPYTAHHTMHPTLYTLHTRHLKPYTIHSTPYAPYT